MRKAFSRFRQFESSMSLLVGKINTQDFHIRERLQKDFALVCT